MEVKYRKNQIFLDARKIIEYYMKDNTYSNIKKKANSIISSNIIITTTNNQLGKYRTLTEKLLPLKTMIKQWSSISRTLIETQLSRNLSNRNAVSVGQIKQKEPIRNTHTTAKKYLQNSDLQLKQIPFTEDHANYWF